MKVYISGRIDTENKDCEKQFRKAEQWWKLKDHAPINPMKFNAFFGFIGAVETMKMRFKLIEVSDCIYMLTGWQGDKDAEAELSYAKALGKTVKYEGKQWSFKKGDLLQVAEDNK